MIGQPEESTAKAWVKGPVGMQREDGNFPARPVRFMRVIAFVNVPPESAILKASELESQPPS